MKTGLILLCVVVAVLAGQLPEDEKERLRQVHLSCQADSKTYCDEDLLRKLGDNVNNPQVGIHMLCMSVKAGLQERNGDLNRSFIKSRIALVTEQAKVDGYVQKCAVKKETPEKTAAMLWLCFVQNGINYYHKL
uniref:Odorant binding protein n=1 Tax=Colaphellus bowringi TaxID=561076 RepID=A0A0S3J404_9CUCU|nr:odorant binding protein [Colaphellus bowringi]